MPPPHPVLDRGLRILQSYGVDWLLAVLIASFSQFYLGRFQNIPDFDLTDTTIQYSFKAKEVFPNKTLGFILAFAYVLLIVSNLSLSRNMWDLHHALLGLTVAFSVMGTFEQIVRVNVGRPRPDFIARCNPFANATNGHFFGLANVTTVCQTSVTDDLIKEGMRSFFSGHACLSAAGLGFVSLYWAGKFHLFNRKSYTSKSWLVFSPLMVSIYICITRVTDHRHHWEDVTVGFFLGILSSYVFYRQFYPSLEDPHCDLPFPPRLASQETGRGPSRTWGPRQWISAPDEQPVPLLPTSNPSRRDMRDSTSYHGHVEAELESGGLIATPFNPAEHETSYLGMPKPAAPHSSSY
ncbi:phosphatidic acid phosphatase type 2/haloperoxidase [Mycena belliarum]|uniref:Phosphatidic acid phosphatase type 2/haloperoxidase n=1 Tax=Mycena belliarum TaxID=1033014 RepID=A0AAD6UI94_9AGAR|nr:phosphatidic acid phosphatase type 2/haloperoxidase [Mycena belliae]